LAGVNRNWPANFCQLKEFLQKKTQRIFTKTQGILRKSQGYANCELEIVAEKCPKKA